MTTNHDHPAAITSAVERPAPHHNIWASVVVDVLAPIGIFYLARALGADQVTALLLGAVAPAARGLQVIVRHRSLDALAGLVLSVIALTVGTSLVTGDARLVLARDAGVTAAVGVWILVTLRLHRPFIYSFCTAFMGAAERSEWAATWDRSVRFRHGMRVMTVIYGVGMLVDSVIRILMAYTLPVDLVPLLNGIQYAVLLVLLFVISAVYSRVTGLVPGSPDYPAKQPKAAQARQDGGEG